MIYAYLGNLSGYAVKNTFLRVSYIPGWFDPYTIVFDSMIRNHWLDKLLGDVPWESVDECTE